VTGIAGAFQDRLDVADEIRRILGTNWLEGDKARTGQPKEGWNPRPHLKNIP
jgi:hypothetical protein